MGVLPRVFFSVSEAAARLGYTPADLAGWAYEEKLEILTGISPVECGGERAAGLVVISVADILPMFRRSGTGPRKMLLRRIRTQGKKDWLLITEPAEGVIIFMEDLLILAAEVDRYDVKREIFVKSHKGQGPEPRFAWDDFWRAVAVRVHEKGVPAKLTDFVNEMADWFMDQSNGEGCPSNSRIQTKLSPLWNRLREDK